MHFGQQNKLVDLTNKFYAIGHIAGHLLQSNGASMPKAIGYAVSFDEAQGFCLLRNVPTALISNLSKQEHRRWMETENNMTFLVNFSTECFCSAYLT